MNGGEDGEENEDETVQVRFKSLHDMKRKKASLVCVFVISLLLLLTLPLSSLGRVKQLLLCPCFRPFFSSFLPSLPSFFPCSPLALLSVFLPIRITPPQLMYQRIMMKECSLKVKRKNKRI
jgi:uncharacterized BrkB/YihY/UPF0761 family membrane protein